MTYFKARGIRDKVHLKYYYPIGRIHTIENVAKWAKPEFDKMGVEYETLFNIREVDAKNKILKSEEGTEVNYDLLIVIPQHRGMEVIERDNMGQGGWIPTDRYKLTMNGHDNVYVVGDTTNLPVSKTGSAAHFQAEVVARTSLPSSRSVPRCATMTARYTASSRPATKRLPTPCSTI
jgi:sulfide:quinone oxidoreductase